MQNERGFDGKSDSGTTNDASAASTVAHSNTSPQFDQSFVSVNPSGLQSNMKHFDNLFMSLIKSAKIHKLPMLEYMIDAQQRRAKFF